MKTDQQSWNSLAQQYADKFNGLDLYLETYRAFSKWVNNPYAHILELGCGPGTATQHLHTNNPRWKLLATDYAPEMVNTAKRINPGVEFQVLDCRQLESLPLTFDGIFAGFCLPYLTEIELELFFSSCAEKLKSGGILYVSFVPGDAHLSGLKKSSDGKVAIHFSYHSNQLIKGTLSKLGMSCIDQFAIDYPISENQTELHQILIFKKQN